MVYSTYKCKSDLYIVEPVDTYDAIESDYTIATADVNIPNKGEYTSNMRQSIDQKLAYHIVKNGSQIGMLYNVITARGYEGACMYCKNDTIGMLIMFKTIFEIYDYHKIYVTPHTDGLKYFISIATPASIVSYHIKGTPLTILRNVLEVQGAKLFSYFKIEVL